MNDFAELGPLMLVVSPQSSLVFGVAAVCGFVSVWLNVRRQGMEFRLLTCGVGLWAAVRDLQIPMDVFLMATLPVWRSGWVGYATTLMGLVEWIYLVITQTNSVDKPNDVWVDELLVFLYVASASSLPRACFRMLLAGLRMWMPRNGVFISAVFVWTGHGGVFARLGSVLLMGLLGKYAVLTIAIAGVADYISSLKLIGTLTSYVKPFAYDCWKSSSPRR